MKGDVVIVVLIFLLFLLFSAIPITCHQAVIRKQSMLAKTGVEMSYWDVFFVGPIIVSNQGTLTIDTNKRN